MADIMGVMAKKNITLITALSAVLLAGCSAEVVPGLTFTPAQDYGNRGDITISAEVLKGSEHDGYHATGGTARFFQDGMEINSAEQKLADKEGFFRVSASNNAELAGKTISVSVYSDNPEDTVKCGIKVTGEDHPVHHAEETEGKGSASCQVKLSSGPFNLPAGSHTSKNNGGHSN